MRSVPLGFVTVNPPRVVKLWFSSRFGLICRFGLKGVCIGLVSSYHANIGDHAAGRALVAAERMEPRGVAIGAQTEGLDVFDGHAGVYQLAMIGRCQIDLPRPGVAELA